MLRPGRSDQESRAIAPFAEQRPVPRPQSPAAYRLRRTPRRPTADRTDQSFKHGGSRPCLLEAGQCCHRSGMLHESALAACLCLVVGLGRATPSARPRVLELMVQIGGGEPSRQEIQQNRSDLHALCLRELKHGYAAYLDILERGTKEEQVHCVDLL